MPQQLNLERSFILSVREFLALRLRQTRNWFWQSRAKTDSLIRNAGSRSGWKALLDRPVAQLSGGQLQRVMIAFSLLAKPICCSWMNRLPAWIPRVNFHFMI